MIYLDNAATTYPKPEAVWREADRFLRCSCGNAGRSGHRLAREAEETVYRCREAVAGLFDGLPECTVFTKNATEALNLCIAVFSRPGREILISDMEHNAVRRPAIARKDCPLRTFHALGSEEEIFRSFVSSLTPKTGLAVCIHSSNLCGVTLPVRRIGEECRKRNIPFVIDASQSAGVLPLSVRECHAAALCAAGHKGLYGLQGCGFALFHPRYAENAGTLPPFLSGGSGMQSFSPMMPSLLPERYEAGTLPAPAIAGLAAGIREIQGIGLPAIAEHEDRLGTYLRTRLAEIPGITLYGSEYGGGTVLFHRNGIPSEQTAELLDREGICVRGGFHCCPSGHRTLGTPEDGAVRASFSIFNTKEDAERLICILSQTLR